MVGGKGTGKSTLLRLINGTDAPTSGTIKSNCRISTPSKYRHGLQPLLSGRQNAKFICRINGYLERAVREHVDRSSGLERYNDVQCLWEEYMAQTITNYLSSWEGRDKKMLVFAGNGHIVYDFGIPTRVLRRNFLPYYTIYPAEFQGNKPTADQNLFLTDIPLEPADFVWVIPTQATPEKRIYLGVQLQKNSDNKLIIEAITPESPAQKAGFQTGDAILSIDGKMVKNVMDLVHYLQTKQFGETCTVVIERERKTISCEVTLFEIIHP